MNRSPEPHQPDGPESPDEPLADAGLEESEIDQVLADSFPASDAPSWTLSIARPPARKSQRKNAKRKTR